MGVVFCRFFFSFSRRDFETVGYSVSKDWICGIRPGEWVTPTPVRECWGYIIVDGCGNSGLDYGPGCGFVWSNHFNPFVLTPKESVCSTGLQETTEKDGMFFMNINVIDKLISPWAWYWFPFGWTRTRDFAVVQTLKKRQAHYQR
jgi:hypothetical protein